MRGRLWAALLVAVLVLRGLGVIPRGREMEELTLITALAADGDEVITVTGVSGVWLGEEPEVLSGTGPGLTAACRDMELSRPARAYLGQSRQLLLGEKLARNGFERVMDFVLTDQSIRLDTLLYIVRGTAGPGLEASLKLASDGETATRRGRTLGELMARLSEGQRVLIPALAIGEDGVLAPAGWALAEEKAVLGFLDGEAASGAALLLGQGIGEVIQLSGGAVELTQVRCWFDGERIHCRLSARLAEGKADVAMLETWAERCLQAALDKGADGWTGELQVKGKVESGWERIGG